jgi:hypothetical protein
VAQRQPAGLTTPSPELNALITLGSGVTPPSLLNLLRLAAPQLFADRQELVELTISCGCWAFRLSPIQSYGSRSGTEWSDRRSASECAGSNSENGSWLERSSAVLFVLVE